MLNGGGWVDTLKCYEAWALWNGRFTLVAAGGRFMKKPRLALWLISPHTLPILFGKCLFFLCVLFGE